MCNLSRVIVRVSVVLKRTVGDTNHSTDTPGFKSFTKYTTKLNMGRL